MNELELKVDHLMLCISFIDRSEDTNSIIKLEKDEIVACFDEVYRLGNIDEHEC
jgi:hypothetical protein